MSWSAGRVVVVGAGIGGLACAAVLARAGVEVTVLEAQGRLGGCAASFSRDGCRFDAGATLALGFQPGGAMDLLGRAAGIAAWPVRPADPAMVVHLPDGVRVTRRAGPERWAERRAAFGQGAEAFWRWQERTADALWRLALRQPAWPPQSARELVGLAATVFSAPSPSVLLDARQPVAAHLRGASDRLRLFVDAQLLISSQATSRETNALFGAAALDLPRRGPAHVAGGMGTLAEVLAKAVRAPGGKVLLGRRVRRIVPFGGRCLTVEVEEGDSLRADAVVADLTPGSLALLLAPGVADRLGRALPWPADGWGAFAAYLRLPASLVPAGFPLHHQVVVAEPLTEGNSIFLSLSPAWDELRAPAGERAATVSAHTRLDTWLAQWEHDRPAYEGRKRALGERILEASERALPDLRGAVSETLFATPATFARFTGRRGGWVGGFPQTNLWRTWGPRVGKRIWLVGDSVFPGQSTAAVALGALRTARSVIRGLTEG